MLCRVMSCRIVIVIGVCQRRHESAFFGHDRFEEAAR